MGGKGPDRPQLRVRKKIFTLDPTWDRPVAPVPDGGLFGSGVSRLWERGLTNALTENVGWMECEWVGTGLVGRTGKMRNVFDVFIFKSRPTLGAAHPPTQ